VSDIRDLAVLEATLQRLCRSLSQYLAESFPWADPGERGTVEQIRRNTSEEAAAAVELGRLYTRRAGAAPYLASYPTVFTNYNFVSLDHCLPRLAEHERGLVASLQQHMQGVRDAEIRLALQNVLEMKQRHLKTVEALAARPAGSAAR